MFQAAPLLRFTLGFDLGWTSPHYLTSLEVGSRYFSPAIDAPGVRIFEDKIVRFALAIDAELRF